ncbi:hypothetical protein [Rhodococcoides fascians]|uniref:hypothetical protein n=1 Tax=Rhodococcoides fascians TaxID=1828 RepID=UPI001427B99F
MHIAAVDLRSRGDGDQFDDFPALVSGVESAVPPSISSFCQWTDQRPTLVNDQGSSNLDVGFIYAPYADPPEHAWSSTKVDDPD